MKRKTGIFNNKTINMEQKFKVGDLVKSKANDGSNGRTGKVTGSELSGRLIVDFGEWFYGHDAFLGNGLRTLWFVDLEDAELAYPSDHDLLDYASRDSKIAELTAENEALKAELEKYKPKPISREIQLFLYKDSYGDPYWSYGNPADGVNVIARKTVTITEGEGM